MSKKLNPAFSTATAEPTPVQPAAEDVPATDEPAPLRRWRVNLYDHPETFACVVEARDEAEAIAAYQKAAGITKTIHAIVATPVE